MVDPEEKRRYLEGYKQAKERGVPFFPDVLFKDAVVSTIVLVGLVGLAYFIGAPLEARADPADTSYTPRPEWYFLFLFQLLKYFPGQLEVIGAFVIPTLALILLFALPFLDTSAKRHPLTRPVVTGVTSATVLAISLLTGQALLEAEPPSEGAAGDRTAALYAGNCAGCHGPSIDVPVGANLHQIIAQGRHAEGMPAWSADLTSDEIDALAGFIASPSGSMLFSQQCAQCHEAPELVAGNPIELKRSLELGQAFEAHQDVSIPDWSEEMTPPQRTDLLNFLVAPDGQRLFSIDCSPCHGQSVAFSGEERELRRIIEQGGLHLDMPPWQGRLQPDQVEALAAYVVEPRQNPGAETLFRQNCGACHGGLVPRSASVEQARDIILRGGPHQTMPVWGEVLTQDQLDALVRYTLQAARGTPLQRGRELFADNCTACHGDFGEGGPNPTRAGDVIAPISSAEFLRTRDDFTLKAIIEQGQPNFGMSPFGTSYGGPLDSDDVEAIVGYIRSWQNNPPVELPPEVEVASLSLSGAEVFSDLCAQCHGEFGQGLVGPSLVDPDYQASHPDAEIYRTINEGHPATSMIGWGEILTAEQIQQLVAFIRGLAEQEPPESGQASFARDVMPILERECAGCHGSLGGWDASSYTAVMTTGDHAPTVIPGETDNSLLAQKLLGTQGTGTIMPPSGRLSQAAIQTILAWIEAGAPDN